MPNYKKLIRRTARRYGVDPGVLTAQIKAESNFNPNARSPAGAQGIAQFIPSTARQYGVNLNDGKVRDDIDGAARYMRDNLRRSGGNYHQALSIYNSGRPDGYKHIPETKAYVAKILGEAGTPKSQRTPSQPSRQGSSYTTTPGVDNSDLRTQAKLAYLQNTHDPNALPTLGLTLRGLKDTPSTRVKVKAQVDKAAGSAIVDGVQAEADRIDAKHYNYAWGGGHNPQGKPTRGSGHGSGPDVGYDCSGVIAKVLGINPRVAADFAKWGKPGRAPGGKGITVYSSPTHVLMEKDGHFFGTSGTNKGGGAGWIPRKAISQQYLKGFVARHA